MVEAADLREPEPLTELAPTGEFFLEPHAEPGPEPEPETGELAAVGAEDAGRSGDTSEVTLDDEWAPLESDDPYVPEPDEGVASSLDWGDEDTGTYSAPV